MTKNNSPHLTSLERNNKFRAKTRPRVRHFSFQSLRIKMCMMQSIRRQWERFLESRVGTCCNCHFCSALSLAFTCEASKHSSARRLQKHQKLLASSAIKLWLIALINTSSSWIGSARWLMIHDVPSNDCKCGGMMRHPLPNRKTKIKNPSCTASLSCSELQKPCSEINFIYSDQWMIGHPASRADLDIIWDHLSISAANPLHGRQVLQEGCSLKSSRNLGLFKQNWGSLRLFAIHF